MIVTVPTVILGLMHHAHRRAGDLATDPTGARRARCLVDNLDLQQAADDAPDGPSLWDNVGQWWSDTWRGGADLGVDVLNGMASWGNAMLQHPEDMAGTVVGLMLIQWGAGGEVLGLAADATGIGATVGIPAGVISAGMIAAGVGMVGVSMADATGHAQTDSKIEPAKKPGRGSETPKKIPAKDVNDAVFENTTKGKNKRVRVVESDEDLQALYDEISKGGKPVRSSSSYDGEMVELADGTRIGLRNTSSSGGRAIDIQ